MLQNKLIESNLFITAFYVSTLFFVSKIIILWLIAFGYLESFSISLFVVLNILIYLGVSLRKFADKFNEVIKEKNTGGVMALFIFLFVNLIVTLYGFARSLNI